MDRLGCMNAGFCDGRAYHWPARAALPPANISFGPPGDNLPSLQDAYAFALQPILVLRPAWHARLLGAVAGMPDGNSFPSYMMNGHCDAAGRLAHLASSVREKSA